MKVMGLLQNQWFKDPERARLVYAKHRGDLSHRAKLNAAYLFMGNGTTARRIKRVFGDEARDWVWENASPEIGGKASAKFPADPEHIDRIIRHHEPDAVVIFGRVAQEAQPIIAGRGIHTIAAPHPAARGSDTVARLCEAARTLDALKLEPTGETR